MLYHTYKKSGGSHSVQCNEITEKDLDLVQNLKRMVNCDTHSWKTNCRCRPPVKGFQWWHRVDIGPRDFHEFDIKVGDFCY